MQLLVRQRAIVKSGVQAESSGDLVCLRYLDAIPEFDTRDHLRQAIKSSLTTPVLLSTFAKLEDHVQHAIPAQATL